MLTFKSGTYFDPSTPNWSLYAVKIKKVVFSVNIIAGADFSKLFYNCSNLTQIQGLEKLDASNVTTMESMFEGCSGLTNFGVTMFNTAKVENMQAMFKGCSGSSTLSLGSTFNTSNVTTMQSMFEGCSSLTNFGVTMFDTAKVENMQAMFKGCSGLSTLSLGNTFNT